MHVSTSPSSFPDQKTIYWTLAAKSLDLTSTTLWCDGFLQCHKALNYSQDKFTHIVLFECTLFQSSITEYHDVDVLLY